MYLLYSTANFQVEAISLFSMQHDRYTVSMQLSGISDPNGTFIVLSLDQIVGIADRFGLHIHNPQEQMHVQELLGELMQQYSPSATGVLVSPELGHDALSNLTEGAGPLFPLERRVFDADPLSIPILASQWGVEAVRNNYGVAKLELFYNPEEKEASPKKQMVAELYDYCKHEGIDLVLELLLYIEGSDFEYKQKFPELQLAAIQELRTSCSLFALEYPLTALGAVTITAELDIPWILTARETPYDVFKEQLRTALESGARGFMGVEQFLPDLPKAGPVVFDEQAALNFIGTVGRDRMLELARITAEAGEKQHS